jgi:predicted glutamine amidotransferase
MCRLLGWATREPTTLRDLVGDEDLLAFTELSARHSDGWGVARATDTGAKVHKRPDTARGSRSFGAWARTHTGDLGMAHLRRATMGLSVGIENTHPFTDGRVAFAHNGSVLSPSALDALIAPEVTRLRHGTTDSERYFLALLTRLADGVPPQDALRDTVDEIARASAFTSLNCLLMTPDELVALCHYDPDGPLEDDAVVVCSSGWGRGWQELANGDLLVVRRGTLATTVLTAEQLAATG